MPPRAPANQTSPQTTYVSSQTEDKKKDGEDRQAPSTQSPQQHDPIHQANPTMTPYGSSSLYGGGYDVGGGMFGAGNMYGGGMGLYGGSSMYGGMGGLGGMYGGMGMMGAGPLSGLNQFLFGVQNVIFSLGQAIQVIGMNTQAVQQVLEAACAMLDHALKSWHEMQVMEASSRDCESPEDRKRRRRLRALRWAMVAAASYAGYALVKRILTPKRQRHAQLSSSTGHGSNSYNTGIYSPPGPYRPGYGY